MELISEIGQAHDGSLGTLYSYIDSLKKCGIKIIKFQIHIPEAESSEFEKFRVNFSYQDKTRFDYWKRTSFSEDEWINIKKYCDKLNIEFLASPFSIQAFELLEKLNVKRYKIGSGELNNYLLLDKIKLTKKPIIISSGMSDLDEVKNSIDRVKNKNSDITLLQCTTKYPTQPKEVGLNLIHTYKDLFKCKVGLSDHSGEIYSMLAATTLGADMLEFHCVYDKNMFGPDSTSSLNFNQIEQLIEGVNYIEEILKNPVDKNDIKHYSNDKKNFGKSLAVNKNLKKGHKLSITDLESKKPYNFGIDPKNYKDILNKKINKELNKWDFLNSKDLEK
tara:strand:+ start:3589 stop:4587 length:999 start_codon:yes stop_codon:yes gene_type:complete